jgi:hypothetical protein
MEAILDEYPDACIIWTHRDPSTAFVSLASLISALQWALLGERPDPAAMGEECRRLWSIALERALEARKTPRVANALVDVSFKQLQADKVGTMERIYDRFGLEFTDEYRRRIKGFESGPPTSQFTKHRYTPEEYGLDVDRVRSEFADYFEEFADLL